ncbi:MAG: AAA family ATPase [Planctomycetes bacterium]|nr:AAA family ATPase [Planctomycetota bacterium]
MPPFKTELDLYIRSRYPVIYVTTWEEERAERVLTEVAQPLGKELHVWTSSEGFRGIDASCTGPLEALDMIARSGARAVFVLKDFHVYLEDAKVIRRMRDLVALLKKSFKTVVLLSPQSKVPVELEKDFVVLPLPLPDAGELRAVLTNFLKSLDGARGVRIDTNEALMERVVKASLGLTEAQAANVYAKAIVNDRAFSMDDLPLISGEKKQVLLQTGLLEYYDSDQSVADIGGLDELKRWLGERNDAFSEKARAYGLPEPKGVLLLGVQGCGKSLCSKAIAAVWKLPLLRFDVGAVFGKFMGQSEENMRKALSIAESLAPAVLWFDEIEKGLSGMKGSAAADSGTTARVFGTFLTWMQEKTKPVFVVATANSIEDMPPELLRKGRFDEIFFVDLPTLSERQTIFDIHLRRRKRDAKKFDVVRLAREGDQFSGAEIEQAIVSAMYTAFAQNREFTTDDVSRSIAETVPLARTMAEKIEELREWAKWRTRPASRIPAKAPLTTPAP